MLKTSEGGDEKIVHVHPAGSPVRLRTECSVSLRYVLMECLNIHM